jgi:hypothetical protein
VSRNLKICRHRGTGGKRPRAIRAHHPPGPTTLPNRGVAVLDMGLITETPRQICPFASSLFSELQWVELKTVGKIPFSSMDRDGTFPAEKRHRHSSVSPWHRQPPAS